jgi:hypothetical protein
MRLKAEIDQPMLKALSLIFDRLVFPKSTTCSCKSLRVEFLAKQRKFRRHFKGVF